MFSKLLIPLALLIFVSLLVSCSHVNTATNKCVSSKNHKIVSVSPTATEMLFAIDAGSLLQAADEFSTYPLEANNVKGLSGFQPNIEAILEYDPDLVLVSSLKQDDEFKKLENFGVCVLRLGAVSNLEGTYEQLLTLGEITQRTIKAQEIVAQLKIRVQDIVANHSSTEVELTYYYELDSTFYSVTENTFIGTVLALLNLKNITELGETIGDYPQLSQEFILNSNPDMILLADTKCCGQNLQTVKDRAGWENIKAVKKENVLELDDDIASRWSTRIVDLLQVVSDFLIEKFK